MKNIILLIVLIFLFFNLSHCSNLFFQWRMTDVEKKQLEQETLELLHTNIELYKKFVSNYLSKNDENSEEPTLGLSRYTYCQKCLSFVKQFKDMKNAYGLDSIVQNLKAVACPLIKASVFDKDVCEGFIDKYGHVVIDSFFTKYFSGYFFCEKIELCPVEVAKNYSNTEKYAKRVISDKKYKPKEKPKENGKIIRMLQITDLHIDREYKANYSSVCLKPICCRNDSTTEPTGNLSGKYGTEAACDIPMILFESFVEDAITRDVDFIIWTGDNAPHDSWKNGQEQVYEIAEEIKSKLDSRFHNDSYKIPIFYSLGNHEKYPNDDFKDNEDNMLAKMAGIFENYLDVKSLETFKKGGYYSKKLERTKLRIIGLNCLACDSFNFNLFNSTKYYAKKMFVWLEKELKDAEDEGDYVFILNHFPLNGDFTLTECAKRLQALFDRFEYTVRGIFSGHTHLDDIEGISEYFNKSKIIHLNFIAPQLTTYSKKLPSYRIYNIDNETMQVLNYEQYRFNLTYSNEKEEPLWYLAYNASDFYNVSNMLDYEKILSCSDMEGYVINRYSGAQIGIANKDKNSSKKRANCTMHTNNFDEYFQCVDPGISLDSMLISVFTNFFIGPFEDFDQ